MASETDSGALLSRYHQLPAGPCVRLRLARRSDEPGLRTLLEQRGVDASDLALSRIVRFDPWSRISICATTPLGGTEAIVGFGSIDLHAEAEPDALIVDEHLTDGLGDLLGSALRSRAQFHARRVA